MVYDCSNAPFPYRLMPAAQPILSVQHALMLNRYKTALSAELRRRRRLRAELDAVAESNVLTVAE
jgi:hypothetical protein